jgi:prepilin-type N-terminal cleavage/methylation domain-containing protein
MKKGFTMIELIFVIVILGILAAVAVPRLAATRDDAALATLKTDVGTLINAVPAWFQGQRTASILEASSIDTNAWTQNGTLADFTAQVDNTDCVQVKIVDLNDTNASQIINANITDPSASTVFNGTPTLQVIRSAAGVGNALCDTFWSANGLGVSEANISMGGRRVQW